MEFNKLYETPDTIPEKRQEEKDASTARRAINDDQGKKLPIAEMGDFIEI
jgi:hypothetical protein